MFHLWKVFLLWVFRKCVSQTEMLFAKHFLCFFFLFLSCATNFKRCLMKERYFLTSSRIYVHTPWIRREKGEERLLTPTVRLEWPSPAKDEAFHFRWNATDLIGSCDLIGKHTRLLEKTEFFSQHIALVWAKLKDFLITQVIHCKYISFWYTHLQRWKCQILSGLH